VCLKWKKEGDIDLDLHVFVKRGDKISHIYYGAMQSESKSVSLAGDCRSGPGEEHVILSMRPDETYHFVAHRYHPEEPATTFAECLAFLDIQQGLPLFSKFIWARDNMHGLWWHVLTISGATGLWAAIDKITNEPLDSLFFGTGNGVFCP
jgi:hypothetical protein